METRILSLCKIQLLNRHKERITKPISGKLPTFPFSFLRAMSAETSQKDKD